jgi:uncharacterized glyoxalase superfamily protein PhnB
MLGTADRDGNEFSRRPTGTAAVHIATDAVEAVFERATAAGADVVTAPADQDYGGRTATVRDPEGNLWSLGSYRARDDGVSLSRPGRPRRS